jgi:drug/metabolite transporter (DMT)-like permease
LSFLFIKEGLHVLTPVGVAFVRCAFGLLALVAISLTKRIALPRDPRVWAHLLVIAACLNIIPNVLVSVAETHISSALAGILNATTPLTSLFFIAIVFRDEPVHRHQIFGLVTGLVGVSVVLAVWRGLGATPWWCIGAMLLATTLYGVSFPYSRRHLLPRGLDSIALATAQMVVATIALLPGFIVDGWSTSHLTIVPIGSMMVMGTVGTGVAYVWNFEIIQRAGSQIASTVTYITPVVAALAGAIVLHEHLGWNLPVGGVIVLLGAAIGQGRFQMFRKELADISK